MKELCGMARNVDQFFVTPDKSFKSMEDVQIATLTPEHPLMERFVSHMTAMRDKDWAQMDNALTVNHSQELKVMVPIAALIHAISDKESSRTVHASTATFTREFAETRDAVMSPHADHYKFFTKTVPAKTVPLMRCLVQTEDTASPTQPRRLQILFLPHQSHWRPPSNHAAPLLVAMSGLMNNSCLKIKLQDSTSTRELETWASSWADPPTSPRLQPHFCLLFSLQYMLTENLTFINLT